MRDANEKLRMQLAAAAALRYKWRGVFKDRASGWTEVMSARKGLKLQ